MTHRHTLNSYAVLDTAPEKQFDDLTELAASILNTPIALVSLIDEERQWFKSHHGLDASDTPREIAFCSHAILQDDVFDIYDSREDQRFFDNPLVTGEPEVIFYTGAPLITPEGNKLGTLCVIDHKSHGFSEENKRQLQIIAQQVMTQLQLRRHLIEQRGDLSKLLLMTEEVNIKNKELVRINKELKDFTSAAPHDDLKAPLIGIGQDKAVVEEVNMDVLARELFALSASKGFKLFIEDELPRFATHKPPFEQVIHNLITHVLKHHHLDKGAISIRCEESENIYRFAVQGDGPGIESQYHEHIFDMFKTLKARDQIEGSGMGLSMVQKIVENYGGGITLESSLNEGSTFYCPQTLVNTMHFSARL